MLELPALPDTSPFWYALKPWGMETAFDCLSKGFPLCHLKRSAILEQLEIA